MMVGLIGRKVGMTQVFDAGGFLTPVTVIRVEDNVVVEKRESERNGYNAVVLGSVDMRKNRIRKPYAGQFQEGITPKKVMVEMRDFEKECSVGDILNVEVMQDIEYVDVVGVSKGKGFQGVVKRHGFRGGHATHGSKFHRENGSTGQSSFPSNVMRGTRMPGRMGGDRCTVQNLRVVRVDAENKVLLIRGAVPGAINATIVVKKARKKQ